MPLYFTVQLFPLPLALLHSLTWFFSTFRGDLQTEGRVSKACSYSTEVLRAKMSLVLTASGAYSKLDFATKLHILNTQLTGFMVITQ